MSKMNLIEGNREKLTVQENVHNILPSKKNIFILIKFFKL